MKVDNGEDLFDEKTATIKYAKTTYQTALVPTSASNTTTKAIRFTFSNPLTNPLKATLGVHPVLTTLPAPTIADAGTSAVVAPASGDPNDQTYTIFDYTFTAGKADSSPVKVQFVAPPAAPNNATNYFIFPGDNLCGCQGAGFFLQR